MPRPTCDFAHVSPCDGGRVGMSGNSDEDTFGHCRRHYNTQLRKIRKAGLTRIEAGLKPLEY